MTPTNNMHDCAGKIAEYMSDAEVTYAVDYVNMKKLGEKARVELKKILGELMRNNDSSKNITILDKVRLPNIFIYDMQIMQSAREERFW